ncbi:hypothetical protein AAC387_Pa05g0488 [Persea americana]
MYKNQLQELAQRSCFNLPSYTCVREGPDHAPRFKATVNFNGEFFESPSFCTTLRQAEHSAAEVALNSLSTRGPSLSLAAKILDETGVYKNLLQEVAQRVGAALPVYTTYRSGLGHLPVFTCEVELAEFKFTGEPAKNKKQAEKNAAMAAWLSLKQFAQQSSASSSEKDTTDEQEHVTVARALQKYRLEEKIAAATTNTSHVLPFPKKFSIQYQKLSTTKPLAATGSKILPLIRHQTTPRNRSTAATMTAGVTNGRSPSSSSLLPATTTMMRVVNDRSSSSSLLPATTAEVTSGNYPLSSSLLTATTTATGVSNGRSTSSSSLLPAAATTTTSGVTNGRSPPSSSILPATTTAAKVTNGRSLFSPSLLPDNLVSILKQLDDQGSCLRKFPAAGAAPYVPVRNFRAPCHGMAPPVTIRTTVPVYSTPPPPSRPAHVTAPAVHVRPVVPVSPSPAPVVRVDGPTIFMGPLNNPLIRTEGPPVIPCPPPLNKPSVPMEETGEATTIDLQESTAVQNMKQLKI